MSRKLSREVNKPTSQTEKKGAEDFIQGRKRGPVKKKVSDLLVKGESKNDHKKKDRNTGGTAKIEGRRGKRGVRFTRQGVKGRPSTRRTLHEKGGGQKLKLKIGSRPGEKKSQRTKDCPRGEGSDQCFQTGGGKKSREHQTGSNGPQSPSTDSKSRGGGEKPSTQERKKKLEREVCAAVRSGPQPTMGGGPQTKTGTKKAKSTLPRTSEGGETGVFWGHKVPEICDQEGRQKWGLRNWKPPDEGKTNLQKKWAA